MIGKGCPASSDADFKRGKEANMAEQSNGISYFIVGLGVGVAVGMLLALRNGGNTGLTSLLAETFGTDREITENSDG